MFLNTAGAGVQIYQEGGTPAENIFVTNASFYNCREVLVSWASRNIHLEKFKAINCAFVLNLQDTQVFVTDGEVNAGHDFFMSDSNPGSDSVISNILFNGAKLY